MKLKAGDNIIVIAGKNKGKTGKILKTYRKHNTVLIDKINLQVKHIKKKGEEPGRKIDREVPIDASNVMLLCPKTKKRSRIGYRILKTGKKERFAKSSNETLT